MNSSELFFLPGSTIGIFSGFGFSLAPLLGSPFSSQLGQNRSRKNDCRADILVRFPFASRALWHFYSKDKSLKETTKLSSLS